MRESKVTAGRRRNSAKGVCVLTDRDYRAVFEASPEAMLIVDREGVIRDLNPRAVAMFGWSREELEGSSVERLVPMASRRRHRKHRENYVNSPPSSPMRQALELLALCKDGTSVPVEVSLGRATLGSGPGHVICAVRDITGWKQMRQVSRTMVAAAENERKSLSRELHDEYLQSLVALKIRVKLLAEEPDEGERGRARVHIARQIHEAIQEVKRMIRGLRPSELEQHGLASALASQFRDLREVYGFKIHASLDQVDDYLDSVATLALYRIIQEAVNNAARHAGVSDATVTVRSEGGVVVAEIRDEGCGFVFDRHLGLNSMRERAAMVGGRIAIATAPGKGTTIRATVPVTGAES